MKLIAIPIALGFLALPAVAQAPAPPDPADIDLSQAVDCAFLRPNPITLAVEPPSCVPRPCADCLALCEGGGIDCLGDRCKFSLCDGQVCPDGGTACLPTGCDLIPCQDPGDPCDALPNCDPGGSGSPTDSCTATKMVAFNHLLIRCDYTCWKDGNAIAFFTTAGGTYVQLDTGCTGFQFGVCWGYAEAECNSIGTAYEIGALCTGEAWGPVIAFAALQCETFGEDPSVAAGVPALSSGAFESLPATENPPTTWDLSASLPGEVLRPKSTLCSGPDCITLVRGINAVWTPGLFVVVKCTDADCRVQPREVRP